jgi:hypothetical protein
MGLGHCHSELGYAAMFLTIRLWLIVITTAWLMIFSFTLDADRMAKVVNEIMHSGKYISLIWLDVFKSWMGS